MERVTDPAWRFDREADLQMFLSVPSITSKEQLPGEPRNLTLTLIADKFLTMSGLMSTRTGLPRGVGGGGGGRLQRSLRQIPRW